MATRYRSVKVSCRYLTNPDVARTKHTIDAKRTHLSIYEPHYEVDTHSEKLIVHYELDMAHNHTMSSAEIWRDHISMGDAP